MDFKILKILVINIICIISIWVVSDYIIFTIYNKDNNAKYSYIVKSTQKFIYNSISYFNGNNNISSGRMPDGIEYSNSPIIVFGCSFAHGQYLNYDQTFSYKLAHILKRPVYNRAIIGGNMAHMYHQVISDDFYKEVPPSNDIFYIIIADHIRRMLVNTFSINNNYFNLHYSYKNHKFNIENYNNIFLNIFKSSYTFKYLENSIVIYIIDKELFPEQISNIMLQYMIESRKELERHWNIKEFNFVIIIYEKMPYEDIFVSKLIKNNFKVIKAYKLTDEDLNSNKYKIQNNWHPKEEAWDLLTPLIIKEAGI